MLVFELTPGKVKVILFGTIALGENKCAPSVVKTVLLDPGFAAIDVCGSHVTYNKPGRSERELVPSKGIGFTIMDIETILYSLYNAT
jgi:predicted RNA binding protein YcfA (HicA-like mRNA interferase family)